MAGPKKLKKKKKGKAKRSAWSLKRRVILVLAGLCVLFCVVFLDVMVLTSDAMMPGLSSGDWVVVWSGALVQPEPEVGDVVLYQLPEGESEVPLVSRVVARAGDRVVLSGERVSVNGVGVELSGPHPRWRAALPDVEDVRRETLKQGELEQFSVLPNGVRHRIVSRSDTLFKHHVERVFEIPDDHFFVLGDRRDGAYDSRSFGPISQGVITGRVWFVLRSAREDGGSLGRYLSWPP